MPVQFRKNCKICIAVKRDSKLLKRIYDSKWYGGPGHESLRKIAMDTGLMYEPLLNHCKKHQHISDELLAEAYTNEVAKQTERKMVLKAVRTSDARQDALDKLATEMGSRDLSELTGRDVLALLLKAAKDADDVSAKKKDQDIDVFRMMAGARSGELSLSSSDEFDPWNEVTEGEVVEPTS